MTTLTHDRYCSEIDHQVTQLRTVVTSGADLSGTVPTCPDWTLEKLVRHMGGALRWVNALVRERAEENIPFERIPLIGGPEARADAGALDAWLAETGRLVVEALREAGPDTKVWSWMEMANTGFWARRMTHEITVHRADATLAAGLPYEVAPEIAADALDEWLEIGQWMLRRGGESPLAPGQSIHLHATDTPAEWLVEGTESGVAWRHGHEKATVALRGPVADVLLAFYRRLPLDSAGLAVSGDRRVLEGWLERSSFG
ncbi:MULTISPECIES: maleylpyruvate isomerase family mycothiol-dependent enzyme [unclassified Streptomyces]|uniref:maleylpyruvate isomerase family mycothiol-dependent enzyme n=1 Tax=unclassified Streptomyces TaxID=2593676 RepID=UPI003D73AC33